MTAAAWIFAALFVVTGLLFLIAMSEVDRLTERERHRRQIDRARRPFIPEQRSNS